MRKCEKKLLKELINNPQKEIDDLINGSLILKETKPEDVPCLINSVAVLKGIKEKGILENIMREL